MIVPKGLAIQDGNKVYKAGFDAPSKFDKIIEKKGELIKAKADAIKLAKDKLEKPKNKKSEDKKVLSKK